MSSISATNLSGVALSGVFVTPGWEPDPLGAIKAIATAGFHRIQVPVWYGLPNPASVVIEGVTYTLAQIVAAVHGLGLAVDATLHLDGPAAASRYMPFEDAAAYASWAHAVLAGVGFNSGDTVCWWNEISPRNDGDWGPLSALYAGLGNDMHRLIVGAGAIPVCPMPMSMTPRDVYNAFTGCLNPQLFRGRPRYGVHLYKDDLPSSAFALRATADESFAGLPAVGLAEAAEPALTSEAALDQQFSWLDGACTFLDGAPIDINEFGGTAPGPSLNSTTPGKPVPDVAFSAGVVSRCAARGWRYCGWQWPDAGDGLTVSTSPALIAALVGPA